MRRDVDPDVRDSRRMSRILRHSPRESGVTLDREGWASVSELSRGSGLSEDRIRSIAETNTRYELSPDGSRIRALHGHSVDVGYGDPVTPPEILYHGTSEEGLEAILASGAILSMRRTMVHLSVSRERAEEVGRRHGSPVVIAVDAGRMAGDGLVFHLSGDGVYLTERVPTGYFVSWERRPPQPVRCHHPLGFRNRSPEGTADPGTSGSSPRTLLGRIGRSGPGSPSLRAGFTPPGSPSPLRTSRASGRCVPP